MMLRGFFPMALLLVLGCSTTPEEPPRRFVIQVNQVEAPEEVGPDEVLTLRFHGMIGTDLCHELDRIDANETASNLDLTFWGVFRPADACPTAIAVLDEVYTKPPPHGDGVNIVVHQADGTTVHYFIPVAGG